MGGAVTGVVGWLFNLGLSREKVHEFEAAIKAGKYLLIVHDTEDTARKARDVLAASRAEQLDLYGQAPA